MSDGSGATPDPQGIVGRLRRRWRFALVLLALMIVGSAATAIVSVRLDEGNAARVNVSGRQRMLSQRIALAASRAVAEPASDDGRLLREAVTLMRTSHARLTDPTVDPDLAGRMDPALEGLYGDGQQVAARVEAYLDSAEVILGWLSSRDPDPEVFPTDRVSRATDFVVDQARGPLLPGLDSVVAAYEAAGDRAIGRTVRVQLVLGAGLLLAIVLVGALIFVPTGRRLQSAMSSLMERERHLRRTQQLRRVGLLAGNVAHDLKNYTGVARGNLQLLQEDLTETSLGPDTVRDALESIERIDLTARRLLALGREEDSPVTRVDLREHIAGISKLLVGSARPIVAGIEVPDEPVPVEVSTTQLEAALLNLIGNAREALQEQGTGRIDIRVVRGPEFARIEVADDGPGIPQSLLPRLFQPFASGREGGTGLGLAQVRRFVDAAGGDVSVDTGPAGTRIHLRLPLVE